MKRLNWAFLALFLIGMAGSTMAEVDKDKGANPDRPIVTTWSKIKELFQ